MTMKTRFLQPSEGRLNAAEAGMTLIEVLVAMFVLSIGVLALLAVQLRTASGVREAEGQTVVSQITQNLIEGMLINPTLSAATDSSGSVTGWTDKSYTRYLTDSQAAASCSPAYTTGMSKATLATAQICQFSNGLYAALPEAKVYFSICQDTSGATPTYADGSVDFNCDGNSGTTVVKVAWLADMETSDDDTSNNNLSVSGNYVVYTYQARVAD
ncbi:type IV pilus modification protein PilV [Neisseria perflava]|uniref:type IV pilus modification protein PilV n=1 Tax=Neisseria perflava TaxID=33053 RepID=UPI00209E1845|nr:type IV pilus modification protein PilV [Neisseria perflava]MCP1660921.1 type IV pilus assembly protein PilV [Neisseria perflava]